MDFSDLRDGGGWIDWRWPRLPAIKKKEREKERVRWMRKRRTDVLNDPNSTVASVVTVIENVILSKHIVLQENITERRRKRRATPTSRTMGGER